MTKGVVSRGEGQAELGYTEECICPDSSACVRIFWP